jgi:hypothetical protein
MTGIDQSYLFLCFGQKYINDTTDFIDTARHFNDNRPVNIVVHPSDEYYAKKLRVFNRIITFDIYSDELFPLCNTNFEKFCLLPRLRLNTFLQSKYTLVLDTDVLCCYNPDKIWEFLIEKKQSLIMLGSKHNESWHWGHWKNICENLNLKPYETHGGLFFIDNTDREGLSKTWNHAIHAFKNFDSLGFMRLYQDGAVDEPCFSYAFNKSNIEPINFSDAPIMTFNLNALSTQIPTKLMTEKEQYCVMNDYIRFIHMFEKNESLNFKLLKQKILQQ